MNKRFVIVSTEETPNFIAYIGLIGDRCPIYTTEELMNVPDANRRMLLTLGEGDAALLIGSEPFKLLREYYHFGIRNENYYDCSKLVRLSIEGGGFVKEIIDLPNQEEIDFFFSPEFTTKVEFPDFRQEVIHTYDRAMAFLEYIDSLPMDEDLGFDYEGSGMPMEVDYELSGFSLSTTSFAGFVSLTDIRHELGGADNEKYKGLLHYLGQVLLKRQDHIMCFNIQYEWQASHRMLGVDLYNLCDVGAVNVIKGNHMKKYSLKWTAQEVLGVNVWDTEFDRISELIDSMLFEVVGKLKAEKHKELKVTKTDFEYTDEWKILMNRYPGYEEEFKALVLEYWGNPFMCIPSNILGYYCNLDAFYTLMIYKKEEHNFSKDCWNVFFDNARLGCRLMTGGLYIDEPFRARYEHYCHQMMAWGITYVAKARCYIKMQAHIKKANDIKKYNRVARKLLSEHQFYNGSAVEIVKNMLARYVDTLDTNETGINEGQLSYDYGDDFAGAFVQIVKDAMVEVKFKGKIDEGIVRKKKILGVIAEKSIPLFGLDKIVLGEKHTELEKYLYYENAYNEFTKVNKKFLNDIYNIPDKIYAFKQKMTLEEYAKFVSDNYFQCLSPEVNEEIVYDFFMLFRSQTSFLAGMFDSVQQVPENGKFYESRGITDINLAYQEFMKEWEQAYNGIPGSLYPMKPFEHAMNYYRCPKRNKDDKKSLKEGHPVYLYSTDDRVKEMWTDFNGWTAQAQFFPEVANQYVEYAKEFVPEDMNDNFFFMRKFTINYLLFKKYAKLCSVYVGSDGMFKKNNKYVIEDEHHLPIRYAKDKNEKGAVEKCFVKYEVNEKSSKRWSKIGRLF